MSLWCSLLGHRFGAAEVEREREERDEEVLTVTREVETCGRCGDRRVVAENTEVTPIEPAPATTADKEEERPVTGGGATAETVEARDPAAEDTEILDDSAADRAPGEWPPEPGESDDESGSTPGVSAGVSDDAPGSLECPACGFSTATAGSSLRAGDSCPECRTGYLESP